MASTLSFGTAVERMSLNISGLNLFSPLDVSDMSEHEKVPEGGYSAGTGKELK